MRTYRSAQYELRTDVTENEAREALVRLEALAQAYQRWLIRPEGGGAGDRPVVAPPPLLKRVTVFRDIDAYEAAGGAAGSGGQFDSAVEAGEGGSLMVFAGPRVDAPTWGRLQHEAFHQLEHRTFPRDGPAELPPWLSEGLAEYFGHGMFTGDRLMPGTIASERLARVKTSLAEGRFLPVHELLAMSRPEWNRDLTEAHYDQAWSLALYLQQGDGGRHSRRFDDFLSLCAQGRPWRQAWRDAGLLEEPGLERAWSRWWLRLEEASTLPQRHEAAVRTLTSFWARAVSQGQAVEQFDRLVSLGRAGQLAFDDRQWLPPALLERALHEADAMERLGGAWQIRRLPGGSGRELVYLSPDGIAYRGRFATAGKQVTAVEVRVEQLPADLLSEFSRLGRIRRE